MGGPSGAHPATRRVHDRPPLGLLTGCTLLLIQQNFVRKLTFLKQISYFHPFRPTAARGAPDGRSCITHHFVGSFPQRISISNLGQIE